ncbi:MULTISPECIES: hypothetical protein [Thermoactinomyces]|jgi:hypothetical protein|uniref:Uncharacterized protein n=1 Tax=Thermoactinomyces daqus TaxID=1329516 RepID=A0A7W1X7D6_9BACL|nr:MULTISPECIES: hypothetical protein [Thermoactinomyces]MBA4541299.1 hypothetical protein [Thermoactinomyces daqus]MBH8596772.1 hypothetical protein [Thermoactinomyces sp. CICC 10523]MBH8603533.1 hypothetical protein [Thermoactinomyces sp. CICC 10522]MBH8606697.1 hypothetical protein [Thermoactinomyces sp. CICC 10521]
MKSAKAWHYLILGLAGLGFVVQLIRAPFSILLPVIIIALIYFLFKTPPQWLLRFTSAHPPLAKKNKGKKARKKKRPFQVIDGNKKY